MNIDRDQATRTSASRIAAAAVVTLFLLLPGRLFAQGDGARVYWKGLSGTKLVPVIVMSMSGNSNPADPGHTVLPGSEFDSTMALAGYMKVFTLGNRTATAMITVPMGRISGDVALGVLDASSSARGFGDPMLQFTYNIVGPKAINNIPDMLRYEPGFSVDLVGNLALPLGEYDDDSSINIGQNRWYGRIGAPIVWQLGAWVPGRRTTLEFLPAVWFFTDNDDFGGRTLETDPMFQVEAHLTRDFVEAAWGSFDVVSISGGEATIDGVSGESLSNLGVGATLGYVINDNMQMTFSYMSSIDDSNPGDLSMDGFRVTFVTGWHPLVEGMKRLGE
jgi:hypothetical protein